MGMNSAPGKTIAAVASGRGAGGIGIVKLSGPRALDVVQGIFRSSSPLRPFDNPKSHRLYHGHIVDPENQGVLDEVLVVWMRGPRSYTREDVVEIQAHAGRVVLNEILRLTLRNGAFLAEPGEFTKRAFLNGRIDLTQAEALVDLINAKTRRALEAAGRQLQGGIGREVENIRDSLKSWLVRLEAGIDFPEEAVDAAGDAAQMAALAANSAKALKRLVHQYDQRAFLRDGVRIMIAGRPNVGKSSLMNCLLQKNRAIVTDTPGTTRDIIEESFSICGVPFVLSDSAGLHSPVDEAERIGVQKAREGIQKSDLVLWVVDSSIGRIENDRRVLEKIKERPILVVYNKIDLISGRPAWQIPEGCRPSGVVYTSALHQRGIDRLREKILEVCHADCDFYEDEMVPTLRQKDALQRALAAVESAVNVSRRALGDELTAIELQESICALGEILGENTKVDILDQIFKQFCIGK